MKPSSGLVNVNGVLIAVVLAVAGGWAGFALPGVLARPDHFTSRVQAIEVAAARIEGAPRESGDPSAYGLKAVCLEPAARAVDSLKDQLTRTAAAAGVATPRISISQPETVEVSGRLTPVLFTLESSGRYDSFLQMMTLLAENRPEIFADTLDLKSQTSTVAFKLSGRILCSTPAV